ncbi:MAG: Uma2 family endonuclease [Chloroflexi bacterium]|nr:Uma2 family endonuclease [Chloroflexota bacterium]
MTTPNIETKLTAQTNGAQGDVVQTQPPDAGEVPWYELINDAPEPPEDAMQQASTILYVMSILWGRYEDDRAVLVSEQTNVIYDSAVPGSVIVPDGYVVFDVPARMIESDRRSYRIDEWGKPPDFVLEVASESTAARDLSEKREIYARMGVQEYWKLDKHGYYGEPLVGERLVNGEYNRFELHTESNGEIWSRSEVLGVDFYHRLEDGISTFSLWDSVTGERLKTPGEEVAARQAAEAWAQDERQMRQEAEARAQDAESRAQDAESRAQGAESRAQSSEAARLAAEAEIERLRRQLHGR